MEVLYDAKLQIYDDPRRSEKPTDPDILALMERARDTQLAPMLFRYETKEEPEPEPEPEPEIEPEPEPEPTGPEPELDHDSVIKLEALFMVRSAHTHTHTHTLSFFPLSLSFFPWLDLFSLPARFVTSPLRSSGTRSSASGRGWAIWRCRS